MKVLAMTFNDGGDPAEITVKMTTEELAAITAFAGSLSVKSQNAAFPDGYGESLSDVYSEANAMVFNRYWDDGVRDVCRLKIDLNKAILEASK